MICTGNVQKIDCFEAGLYPPDLYTLLTVFSVLLFLLPLPRREPDGVRPLAPTELVHGLHLRLVLPAGGEVQDVVGILQGGDRLARISR